MGHGPSGVASVARAGGRRAAARTVRFRPHSTADRRHTEAVDAQLAIIVGLVALVFVLVGLLSKARGRAGVASRRRNARAQRGEAGAEALVAAHGYRICGRQVGYTGTVWVDGAPVDFGIRVDLLLERDGIPYIAEVKTGDLAPDPRHGPTRRQLREYAALLPDHGVLLVDAEAGSIQEIEFS